LWAEDVSEAGCRVNQSAHGFLEGDRVECPTRAGFPPGTVLKVIAQGYLLVHWDSDVLETVHHRQLIKVNTAQR